MHIWIDGDACPNPVKEITFKAAMRTKTALTLVANQDIRVPRSPLIKSIRVSQGFDEADNYIVANAKAGDLLITADIPLAAEAMESGIIAVNPRGELYSQETIKQKLNMRDFMEVMRSSGEHTGGPKPFGNAEKQAYANALDRILRQAEKRNPSN